MEDPRAAFSAHLVPSRAGSAKRQSRVGRPGSCARSTEPSGSTSFLSSSKLWLPGLSLRQRHTGKRQCVTIRNHKSLLFGSHTSQTRARAPSAGRRAGGRRKQPQPSSRCWALLLQLVCQLDRQGRAPIMRSLMATANHGGGGDWSGLRGWHLRCHAARAGNQIIRFPCLEGSILVPACLGRTPRSTAISATPRRRSF
jgi:hypothetical protein